MNRARRFRAGTATLTGPTAPESTTVDAAGQFRFLKVPPEQVQRSSSRCPGFTTVTRENVIVTLGKDTNVDIKLKISNVQENVVVSGATPLIDTRKVSIGRDLRARGADRHPDRPRHLGPDPAGSRRPARPGQRRRQLRAPTAGGPGFHQQGDPATSPTRSTARRSPTTPTAIRGDAARQSGGTNTFFDFDTFQNVEVATGGSLLELAELRRHDQRRDQARHQRVQGLRAATSTPRTTWESNNRSQEAIDQGFQTEQRSASSASTAASWAARSSRTSSGSGPRAHVRTSRPNPMQRRFRPPGPSRRRPCQLEPWNAKLNWQVVGHQRAQPLSTSAATASSSAASPARTSRAGLRDSAPTASSRPTSTRPRTTTSSRSDLFASIFLNYQAVHYDRHPAKRPQRPEAAGSTTTTSGTTAGTTTTRRIRRSRPTRQVSKFFSTGKTQPRAEGELQLPPADRRLGHRPARRPGSTGYEYSYSSATARGVTGGVRTIFKTEF